MSLPGPLGKAGRNTGQTKLRALTCHVPVTVDSCVSEEWAVNVLEAVWSLWWIGLAMTRMN